MAVQEDVFCANCGSKFHAETCPYCGHVCRRKDGFLARIRTSLKDGSWYKDPFWVTVVGTVIGAVVLISGQIAATYLTIYTSSDASDFGISVDKIHFNLYKYNDNNDIRLFSMGDPNEKPRMLGPMKSFNATVNITISDAHHILKPYPHRVFVNASNIIPKGVKIEIDNPDGIPPFKTSMNITTTTEANLGYYPITIQALGGDGRTRRCQIYIKLNGNGNTASDYVFSMDRWKDECFRNFRSVSSG